MELNISIFQWLHGFAHQSALVDAIIRFCTDPLGILLVVCVAWYLLQHHTHMHGAWEVVVFLGLAFFSSIIAYGMKEFFPTIRPFEYFPLTPLVSVNGAAFPSMHTAFYVALGSAMAVAHPRSGSAAIVLGVVVGVARVIAGIHWPFDILFGALLGGAVGWGGAKLCYQWMCRILKVCIV